ncbi:hypothetical protein NDU88_005596 [Pleurodeles waltl]|uniref:Uncharacterized protein n=1 Tax=Pleurodeles waltl TaxID=8319 RepID=A0AAV7QF73_PLEWA|nr:hypothetical protein NDU88_005596 [Pleurodeles waltl]
MGGTHLRAKLTCFCVGHAAFYFVFAFVDYVVDTMDLASVTSMRRKKSWKRSRCPVNPSSGQTLGRDATHGLALTMTFQSWPYGGALGGVYLWWWWARVRGPFTQPL